MSADDILYAPIVKWRDICYEIAVWIDSNRKTDRMVYSVSRERPHGALYLIEFVEAFYVYGQKVFWRAHYPDIIVFEFDGNINMIGETIAYPSYGEIGNSTLRSIEDHNLVPNTYTSIYVFRSITEAEAGLKFVVAQNSP